VSISKGLVTLYQEMSSLTAGICVNECAEKWGSLSGPGRPASSRRLKLFAKSYGSTCCSPEVREALNDLGVEVRKSKINVHSGTD
jgi:hypothetical protein